jgi:hypothetical protein
MIGSGAFYRGNGFRARGKSQIQRTIKKMQAALKNIILWPGIVVFIPTCCRQTQCVCFGMTHHTGVGEHCV